METISARYIKKAKIDHKCNFCGQPILKGSPYNVVNHKAYGMLYTWKSHLYCQDIAYELRMYEQSDEGVTSEDFHEYISTKYSDLNQDEIYDAKTFVEELGVVLDHYKINK